MMSSRRGRTRFLDVAVSSMTTSRTGFGIPPMDQHTFDRLTRAIAAGQDRRTFLRRLFGMGAAVAVGSGTIHDTLAAPIVGGTPSSTTPLREPSEPANPAAVLQTQPDQDAICLEPLVESD